MTHPLDAALALALKGDSEQSESILLRLPEDDCRVRFNLGWHKMRHGLLSEGLRHMDAGRFISCFGSGPVPGIIWRDQDLTNKTLLFRCEGGFGDQILNFRFAKDFQRKGARVVVACSPQLMPLFSRHGFVCISDQSIEGLHYDYWVPGMSAAHVLGYEFETLSGQSYLTPKKSRSLGTRERPKIGLRWSGNPAFEHQQHRRFPPDLMIDLSKVQGAEYFSLQRDEDLRENLPFTDLKDSMTTWEDTAEIVGGLDLVITSCTSIAHLSGALGVETWVVVPVLPYYTWAVPGQRSAWYDSVRLFRQKTHNEWSDPFSEVTAELVRKLAGSRALV